MTDWLYQTFGIHLTQTYFLKALIGGSIVACVCGVVGCLVILRRMAFLGDALSHAMIAGVVCGYLFMKLAFGIEANAPAMLIGSIIAAGITVALIGFVSKASRLKEDTVIGIMYCGIFALGIVILSIFQKHVHIDIMHFIMGDILGIGDSDMWLTVIVAVIVLTVIILFFRFFQITSFDPIMAASIGIPVLLFDYILTTCMSFVVVSAVSMVGVILSVGLLITPAATAYLLTDRLNRMMIIAAISGVTSVIGGLYLSVWLNAAGGVSIMLFCTLQFIAVLIFAPRYGLMADWLRRKRLVPQQLLEDILRSVHKLGGENVPISNIANSIKVELGKVKKAITSMISEGLLDKQNSQVTLTGKGQLHSKRMMRSHRLWESYLKHVGMEMEKIHDQAEQLEHIHDEETVDYIDDKLGHPTKDPHGEEIPEDFIHTPKGEIAPVSLLRTGRHAEIQRIKDNTIDIQLTPGEMISLGERQDNGATWVVIREDGEQIYLNHKQADAILVKTID